MRGGELIKDKLAVVLSGGGLRSAAHIGVLKVLEEYGIKPDSLVGTSGGAVVAAFYASGLTPLEIETLYLSIIGRENQYIDFAVGQLWQALLKLDLSKVKGLIKGEKLRRFIADHLRYLQNFTDYNQLNSDQKGQVTELYLTAVDINDGTEVVFCPPQAVTAADYGPGFTEFRLCSEVAIADAVRCSIGIPGTFIPYCLDGNHYVDGGLRDNLPVAVAVKLAKAKKVLGVDLGYAGLRKEDLVKNGIVDILSQTVDIMAMDQLAADLYDQTIRQAALVILNPLIYDVGLVDTHLIPTMIHRGELLAETYCQLKGLQKGQENAATNRALLFIDAEQPVLFPMKGTPEYQVFRKQLSDQIDRLIEPDSLFTQLGQFLRRTRNKLFLAAGLVLLVSGLILVWGDPAVVQFLGLSGILLGLVIIYGSNK